MANCYECMYFIVLTNADVLSPRCGRDVRRLKKKGREGKKNVGERRDGRRQAGGVVVHRLLRELFLVTQTLEPRAP